MRRIRLFGKTLLCRHEIASFPWLRNLAREMDGSPNGSECSLPDSIHPFCFRASTKFGVHTKRDPNHRFRASPAALLVVGIARAFPATSYGPARRFPRRPHEPHAAHA